MSDETRTVTVESLATALDSEVPAFLDYNMWPETRDKLAAAIFAALPVATAGPDLREALRVALDDVPVPAARTYVSGGGSSSEMADAILAHPKFAAALRGAAAQADGGEPAGDAETCWSCGRRYADEAEMFCGWCGARAAQADTAPEGGERLRDALTDIRNIADGLDGPLLDHYRREVIRIADAALAASEPAT